MPVTGKPVPPPVTLLDAIEREARNTLKAAQQDIRVIVQRDTPGKGVLASKLTPRISRTSTGVALTVGVSRGAKDGRANLSDVLKWVTRGTGIYRVGPGPKRPIRAKNPLRRMTLPGGQKRWSVKGQHPNPFMERIRDEGTRRVTAHAEAGAHAAARAVEDAII